MAKLSDVKLYGEEEITEETVKREHYSISFDFPDNISEEKADKIGKLLTAIDTLLEKAVEDETILWQFRHYMFAEDVTHEHEP